MLGIGADADIRARSSSLWTRASSALFTVRSHPAAPAVPRASGAEAGTVTDVGDTRGFLPKAPCPCKQSRTVLLLAGCTCAMNFRWSEPDCVLCSRELQSASESCSEMPPFFGAAGINISLSSTALLLLRLFHARARSPRSAWGILVQFLFALVHIYLLQWRHSLYTLLWTPWAVSGRAELPGVQAHQMQDTAVGCAWSYVHLCDCWPGTATCLGFFCRTAVCLVSGNSRKLETYFQQNRTEKMSG